MYYRQGREQKIKNFGSDQIVLTLKLKEKMSNKNYDLYTVCKIVDEKEIPLYNETFTNEQVEKFYQKPSYYIPKRNNKEDINNE